jgi:hypothetical protein
MCRISSPDADRAWCTSWSQKTELSRHMRRYREPPSVPARPDIGIAAIPLLAVRRGVAGARMDDGDITENAHFDVLRREAADRHWSRGLCKKLALVDQRPVGVRTQKVVSQDLVETSDIAVLDRLDVVAVERSQRVNVGLGRCVCLQVTLSKPPYDVVIGRSCLRMKTRS